MLWQQWWVETNKTIPVIGLMHDWKNNEKKFNQNYLII